jgi:hypothetical protein
MQRAAQLREAKTKSSRLWFVSLRRMAVTLAVVAILFVSGTGLVRAASDTLPGDNLYPVKRTWEDVLLLFTFNVQQRASLEVEHENERLHELKELFAEGRSAEVDFAGTVTSQSGNELIVSGVRVMISSQTRIPEDPILAGSAVRVRGVTQGQDTVIAERIQLLSPDDQLPDIEYEHEGKEDNSNEGSSHQEEDNSGPGSGNEDPRIEESQTPEPERRNASFEGVVASVDNNVVVVNGVVIDMSVAEEIKGTPSVGATVKVDGYYDSNGVFIVTRIEFKNEDSINGNENSSEDSNSNTNENSNNNDNDNGDDHGGNDDNSNDDHGGNDNGDDSGGGGDNSGSGGGGGDDD